MLSLYMYSIADYQSFTVLFLCVCASEGCNSSTSSADGAQHRLYSPTNHVSPGKSGSCLNKRPASSSTATTPPCGVLKNVMVSHHMDRSSSTPRLTLKFHHVKRHENGVTTAAVADSTRLHSTVDGANQLPAAAVSVGGKIAAGGVSCVDSHYPTASSLGMRYHSADANCETHHVSKNRFEKSYNDSSGEQQSVVTPFSPQFEDISDAEDDVQPASRNPPRVDTPAAYSLSPLTAQCLPPLSIGLCPSTASSTFSSVITASSSFPQIWNSYPVFASQAPVTWPASVGQPSSRLLPWIHENHSQAGLVNHLPPVVSSTSNNGRVPTPDALQPNMPPRQPFSGNRFAASEAAVFPKSEFLPVKSEVSQIDASLGCQTSVKSENYNGHMFDMKSDSCTKGESPGINLSRSRELCSSTSESKPNFFTARLKSEEMLLSNRDRDTVRDDNKDSVKSESHDSKQNLHSSVQIKPDIDNTSRCVPCYHPPAKSVSPSGCPELGVTVDSTPLAQATADVSQIPNNLEPKVPPLRIIIPSKVCPSGLLPDGLNTNSTSRCGVNSLPYVVSRTHSADSDVLAGTVDALHCSDSAPAAFGSSDNDRLSASKESLANSDLVPAKRRKIKHSSKVSVACIK